MVGDTLPGSFDSAPNSDVVNKSNRRCAQDDSHEKHGSDQVSRHMMPATLNSPRSLNIYAIVPMSTGECSRGQTRMLICISRFRAGMAELADAADSKSAEGHPSWGFDSPSRHQ